MNCGKCQVVTLQKVEKVKGGENVSHATVWKMNIFWLRILRVNIFIMFKQHEHCHMKPEKKTVMKI